MLLSLRVALRATVLFLVEFVLSPLQTWFGEQPSPALKVNVVLRVLLALASGPGWLVLFLPMHDEGELWSHQLVDGVGMAHLPTLILLMAGAQWTLHDWTEGPAIPLGVRPQFCRTSPPARLPVSARFPVMRH
jgi:hypothetical protein